MDFMAAFGFRRLCLGRYHPRAHIDFSDVIHTRGKPQPRSIKHGPEPKMVIYKGSGQASTVALPKCNVRISSVKEKPSAFSRRKFSAVIRKGIISYYTEKEKQEIAHASKRNGVSMSNFIASAALREARQRSRKVPPR